MPRRARLKVAGNPHHVVQRGNNRADCFFSEKDYRFYLCCLRELAEGYRCAVHAYVLNPNHVHLLVTPETEDALSLMMRSLSSRYAQYVNHVYRRSGTLWEGRYRSSIIESERYLLTCYRYIELDPIRLRLVAHPGDYAWSSYRCHALGNSDGVIRDHPLYRALGATPEARALAYRELFRHPITEQEIAEIRTSWKTGLVLGGDSFKNEIERIVERPVRPGKGGRPKKTESGWISVERNHAAPDQGNTPPAGR
jgi:putative transposase